jgi:hypothetical protein
LHQAPSIDSPAEPIAPAQNPTRDLRARADLGLWLTVACALALSLILQQTRLLTVWRAGGFFDTDDAMRMVQVRDLLAGQGWYDMTQWRLDPPGGVFMHWSRIVDIPIVLLLKIFGLFLAPEQAERAARIAFPTLIFAFLLSGGAWAARIFAGASARVYGVFAVLFCGVFFWQFPPGRIDHHAPQITLLFFCVAALARAFDPAQARWAALAGACMAVSLGIGLENVPFFALIAVMPSLAFALRGDEARGLLRSFSAGLGLTLFAVFLLTVGPKRWFVPACDALSAPWLVGALGGAAAYALLSLCGSWSLAGRFVALVGLGVAALAPFVLIWPNCLGAPYASVDPVVRNLWLDHVSENLTLSQDFAISPGGALLMAAPILIGLCGALFGALHTRGVARLRWLFLVTVVAMGFAAACLCLRVFSSIMPLAALGLLAPVAFLRQRLAGCSEALAATASFVALFVLSSFGVALALPDLEPSAGAENSPNMFWRRPSACLDSASYEPLAGLSPGLAVAPVAAGSYLLAHTRLSVSAAPYHRNNHGNRAALDILRSAPALAESLARKAGAAYVLLCWNAPADVAAYKAMGADSLAARIVAGQAPGWLRALPVTGTPLHVFTVTPPGD